MFTVPISHVADSLTLNAVIEISRFRFRCPALTGLHVGSPLLAFEPKNFDYTPPPDIYVLPPQLARLVIVGLAPDWNEHLLDTAREVGMWAAGNQPIREAVARGASTSQAKPPVAFGAPQARASLKKIYRQMEESETTVTGFSLTKKKRYLEGAAAVLVEGADVTDEFRRRMDLQQDATLSFLSSNRGWHI